MSAAHCIRLTTPLNASGRGVVGIVFLINATGTGRNIGTTNANIVDKGVLFAIKGIPFSFIFIAFQNSSITTSACNLVWIRVENPVP
jgi:hypothetical protein